VCVCVCGGGVISYIYIHTHTHTYKHIHTLPFKSLGSLRKRKKTLEMSLFFKVKHSFFSPNEDNFRLIRNTLYALMW